MSALVSVVGARASRSPVLILPDVSIAAGQHTLLLGHSGCGKTTLLNLVAGLLPAVSGEVTVCATSLVGLSESARDSFRAACVGIIMQRLHLISALTVFENLALARRLAGLPVDERAIRTTLESLNVGEKWNVRPHQLSQGEAQRVAIARAIVNRPALILADEPTSALDDANSAAAMTLLFSVAAESGATLLVATHDSRICERFAHVIRFPERGAA